MIGRRPRGFYSLRWLWRSWTSRTRFEEELAEELAFHLAARREDLERAGLDRAAALRQARIELGMVERHKDDCRRVRGLSWLETLWADTRYAGRTLWRDRGFTATALAVLAVALAANLLLFVFVRAYVFGGGVAAPRGAWVDVAAVDAVGRQSVLFTAPEVEAILPLLAAGPATAVFQTVELRQALAETGRTGYGRAVSAQYWRAVGVAPLAGRLLTAEEDRRGAGPPAVLLTESGWRRLFAEDPAALGRTLTLDGRPHVVAGIVPDAAKGFDPLIPQYFVAVGSLAPRAAAGGEEQRYEIGAVLAAAGPTAAAAANAALAPAIAGLRALAPERPALEILRAVPRRGLLPASDAAELAGAVITIGVAFALVLLVACANLANLSLSRAVSRQREIAVRLSLGASRGRIVRQLLTESVLVALLAGGGALLLATLGVRALQQYVFRLVAESGLDVSPIAPDPWVGLCALVLAVLAGLAFGLMPALEVTARELGVAAKRHARVLGGRVRAETLRRTLIVAQVAVSLVLLVVASLAIVNALGAASLPLGYDATRVFDAGMTPPSGELVRRLEAEPGIEAVSAASRLPLTGAQPRVAVRVGATESSAAVGVVDARYFTTLALPLAAGRGFERSEAASRARVAVVSESTARRLWPGSSALGGRLDVVADPEGDMPGAAPGTYQVVGVVRDVVGGWFFGNRSANTVYLPGTLGGEGVGALLVRAAPGAREATLERLRRVCREIDPAAACEPAPLTRYLSMQRSPFEVAGALAGALGLAAALISGLGLYGVVGFQVSQRTREFGVRAALGASPGGIVRLALGSAGRAVVLGLAIGLPFCLAASALLRSVAPALASFAPEVYLGVPLALAALVLAGAAAPAVRAARVDPVIALRAD